MAPAISLLEVTSAALIGSGVVAGVFAWSTISALARRGAPFVPTSQRKIDHIICGTKGLLRVLPPAQRASMHVVDLGSGSGSLVRAAVRRGGFGRGSGFELNPGLVAWSRLGSFLSSTESFHLADLWTADIADADIIFVYGVPSILGALERKLVSELRDGAFVVSNNFPFAADGQSEAPRLVLLDKQHIDVSRFELDDSSNVFLYEVVRGATRASGTARRER